MNIYRLQQKDQLRASWVILSETEPPRKRTTPAGVPPTVRRLLGSPSEGQLHLKAQYAALVCKTCKRYDAYRMFDLGFDDDVTIRIKGDFAHTDDRVFLVGNRFLDVLKSSDVSGYEVKALGVTGWHALRVTRLVDSEASVIKTSGQPCAECGRPREAWGVHEHLGQVSLPTESNTFFTTRKSSPTPFYDRDIFITEEVVEALKRGGIKGGYCYRLFTTEEWHNMEEDQKKGID